MPSVGCMSSTKRRYMRSTCGSGLTGGSGPSGSTPSSATWTANRRTRRRTDMETSYDSIEGRPTLRFERRLAHPVAAVWSAITDPGELAQWFPSTVSGELRAGSGLSFSFPEHPDVADMKGSVTDFDPP